MYVKKLMLAVAVAGAFGLSACTEGDENSLVIEGGGGGGSTTSSCPDWTSARPKDADGNNVCQLPATISVNRTLSADTVWYMAERVTVGNGNGSMGATQGVLANGTPVLNVTLTIEPGTEIKGATGSFANLVITRGSKIMAEGTASAPITFSSYDAGYTGTGEWGGLVIHGYGDHNVCSALPCNIDAEGESGFAGGFGTPADNSGSLKYVRVAEGGFEFAPGNEINGISLVAVGSGTTMDYIQVASNSDDGVEFYGGAVNAKHLVLTGNLDDSIDWDEGYQGNIQFAIVKQTAAVEGNAVEGDTEGTKAFLSKPTLANITFIGHGTQTTMLVLKSSSAGFFHNSIITTDAANTGIATCVTVTGSGAQANRNTSIVFNNVIADCTAFGDSVLDQATVFSVDAALGANYASAAPQAKLAAPISWTAIRTAYPESVANTTYLVGTDYLGAVNPNGSDLWYQGWTLEGSL